MESPILEEPSVRPGIDRLRFRALQVRGKLRRFFRSKVYTKNNDSMLEKRRGECTRCGACCKILVRCPFLEEIDGAYNCQIYGDHFAQCRIFPLVPQDLKEVDAECGYYFVSE